MTGIPDDTQGDEQKQCHCRYRKTPVVTEPIHDRMSQVINFPLEPRDIRIDPAQGKSRIKIPVRLHSQLIDLKGSEGRYPPVLKPLALFTTEQQPMDGHLYLGLPPEAVQLDTQPQFGSRWDCLELCAPSIVDMS